MSTRRKPRQLTVPRAPIGSVRRQRAVEAGQLPLPLLDEDMRVVVLGVGNILLSDEGVGVRAVQQLGRDYELPPEVCLIDAGTAALSVLGDVSDCDLLLAADAVCAGGTPGSLLRLEGREIPARFTAKVSPHQAGLPELLASLLLTDMAPRRTVLYGVEPGCLSSGTDLSHAVAKQLPRLVASLAAELAAIGLDIYPKV